jgi:hypothetical protein
MDHENNFDACLAASHAAEDFPLWEECYRKFFPDFQAMISHRQDGEHQRAGIDRSVVLRNSKQLLVDEKIRFRNRNGEVYDIALEEWSKDSPPTLGWVEKPLRADYIAYAIGPLGKCYLLPVTILQQAWRVHKVEWKSRYPKIPAKNRNYTTISWGIPVPVVFAAMGSFLRCSFEAIERDGSLVNKPTKSTQRNSVPETAGLVPVQTGFLF